MKKDISNKEDIIRLVDDFYGKINNDPIIGFLFTEIAQVQWEKHLPRMYDFWDNVLFFSGNYDGNPMQKHKELHQKYPLTSLHFERWTNIFVQTVDDLFLGEKASEIKMRAKSIAEVMMYKTIHH